MAFVANLAHLTEIGGKAPGGFAADATDIYQEGLRLPPSSSCVGGERNEDVWRILLTNHRTPRATWGDLHAMIGSLNVGEQRLLALLERFGPAEIERLSDALLDYSERRMRAEIAAIPDGRYAFEDVIENDGVDPDSALLDPGRGLRRRGRGRCSTSGRATTRRRGRATRPSA